MEEPDSATESTSASASSLSLPDGKDYHAFICFNIADQEFVDETIAYLESPKIGFKCVDHRRDFHPGKTTVRNIEEFIDKSWKYVLIISPAFVESEWCSFETDIMMNLSLEQREECIIPVLYKPCTMPRSLSFFTYVEVGKMNRWKERLVKAIQRADISSKRSQLSNEIRRQLFDQRNDQRKAYQETVDQYEQEKKNIQLEEEALEKQVNKAFDICSNNLQVLLGQLRRDKLAEVQFQMDQRRSDLVKKRHTAQKLLNYMGPNFKRNDATTVKNFTSLLDEHEELVKRQDISSFTEFVVSEELVDTMTELLSQFDVGHLRQVAVTHIKTQQDRDNYIKERTLSWNILPQEGEQTIRTIVRCPYFKFDPRTVLEENSISAGSLTNQIPPRRHPPSDRRLSKYCGAVGTTRFTSRGIYYWQNKWDVDMDEALNVDMWVCEVGLSTRGVLDELSTLVTAAGARVLRIFCCKDHFKHTVCLLMYKDDARTHHQTLFPNRTGQWPSIVLGFLLDTIRQRWTVFDVTKQKEIAVMEDIGDAEEFTPMFAVYGRMCGSVKVSLITGTDLNVSDDMYSLIQSALD